MRLTISLDEVKKIVRSHLLNKGFHIDENDEGEILYQYDRDSETNDVASIAFDIEDA